VRAKSLLIPVLMFVLCVPSALIAPAFASPQQGMPPGDASQFPGVSRRPSEPEIEMQHEREKAVNKQRQQNLKRDTDKLLELATELKQSVDKSNENTLSLDVIKKAEEIEKLAKSVREKMKGS